ncbi:MAG: tRNA (adenosine(37)-N6)-threonylcarbamoyltransferase complex dimerization subunit type 1 TsaB [Bacteroidota bacterium]
MAIILNLETATTNCSVCVASEGKAIGIKEQNTPKYSHAEQLHVFIAKAIEESGLTLADLDAVAISKGPGSYTGLRIGVSAAKGLCFALDIPLISLPTLASMAHQVMAQSFDFIISVLDARRMEVYSAVFDKKLQQIRDTRAEIITETSFAEYLDTGKVLILGPGAEKCQTVLEHTNANFEASVVPSAVQMAALSQQKYENANLEDTAYFEPYYLKDFIAHTLKSKPKD